MPRGYCENPWEKHLIFWEELDFKTNILLTLKDHQELRLALGVRAVLNRARNL